MRRSSLGHPHPTRRQLLTWLALGTTGAALAACGAATTPTAAPKAAPATPVPPAAPTTAAATGPASTPITAAAPTVIVPKIRDITLRQIGTGTATNDTLREQAEKDLGFKIAMKPLSTADSNRMAITQPNQYDIFDGEYSSISLIISSGNIQPAETKRVKRFNDIVPIFTTGKLSPTSMVGQGTAPHKVMFVAGPDGTKFSSTPTEYLSLVPTIFNADSLGYRPDLVGRKIESWGDLFSKELKGKAGLFDLPSNGIMDAAMVVEALGLMSFGDKGNMTKEEIDQITKILIDQKKAGQFKGFWKTFDESVTMMASGDVAMQSMWLTAVAAVKAKGLPCVYAPLKEGYRSWARGLGFSKALSGSALDAAYDYVNWWLEGSPGATLGRQGYYSAVPATVKSVMTPADWDFWYEGKPAAADVIDSFGKKIDPKGALRDGGSFQERMNRVACWNSTMDEQPYLVKKWSEFIGA